MNAIDVVALTKVFHHQSWKSLFSSAGAGRTVAVDGLSLRVEEGEILGLLGPNGAGKTTFIKLLCTLLLPTSGKAEIFGHDVVSESALVRRDVGLVTSDERSFYWRLTGRQNLEFFAAVVQTPAAEAERRIGEMIEILRLGDYIDDRFNEYSTGMKQKLAIARGLLNSPRLLFMDEPTKGLDPVARHDFMALLRETVAGKSGRTVVLCTNVTSEAEEVCSRIAIINHGRLIASGTPREIRSAADRSQSYRFRIRGPVEADLAGLRRIEGVANVSLQTGSNGDGELILKTNDDLALSQALRFLLAGRLEILTCDRQETSFDELIRSLMGAGKEATRP